MRAQRQSGKIQGEGPAQGKSLRQDKLGVSEEEKSQNGWKTVNEGKWEGDKICEEAVV